tara:strand:+ start:89 stop:376 length:288 start_codon:yes stop_codon:yes gene_type:complete
VFFLVDSKTSWCYYKDIIKKEKNMGMSNWILGNEEKFWSIAEETIGECEVFEQFYSAMKTHTDLLTGSPSECNNLNDFEDMLSEAWNEKWSEYVE